VRSIAATDTSLEVASHVPDGEVGQVIAELRGMPGHLSAGRTQFGRSDPVDSDGSA